MEITQEHRRHRSRHLASGQRDVVFLDAELPGVDKAISGDGGRQKQGDQVEPSILQAEKHTCRVKEEKADGHAGKQTEQGSAQIE